MREWIHVITATKLPIPRGWPPQVFHFYDDSIDPNDGTPFGPSKETMFLPVSRPEMPVVNEVLLKVVQQSTVGADGVSYPGQYDDPDWVVGWDELPQDIERSRELKTAALYRDRDARVAKGYVVSANGKTLIFPLTDDFAAMLTLRQRQLELAVNALEVNANQKITFADLNEIEVPVGLTTLTTHVINFSKLYWGMNEKLVKARASILAAATPEAVDSVTWNMMA